MSVRCGSESRFQNQNDAIRGRATRAKDTPVQLSFDGTSKGSTTPPRHFPRSEVESHLNSRIPMSPRERQQRHRTIRKSEQRIDDRINIRHDPRLFKCANSLANLRPSPKLRSIATSRHRHQLYHPDSQPVRQVAMDYVEQRMAQEAAKSAGTVEYVFLPLSPSL